MNPVTSNQLKEKRKKISKLINEKRLDLEQSEGHTIAALHLKSQALTLVFEDGTFCHFEIEQHYHGYPQIIAWSELGFDDAAKYGILPRKMLDDVHEADRAFNAQIEQATALKSLNSAIETLGKETVKKLIGE